ncbi:c-type cytochrome biogenesis protein CcsB [Actinopolymorpha alba]|uniref:c-type cytochrome biogenesis protein CcsB n=1 Tax=Actinopolymorpha alba TaxID=533267 RepID=UPI00058CC88E|nr:c-type cytochrome biogenesis protein CcsB [Actinopolymorpha alba]
MLASLSDNFVHAATVVVALGMLAHAGEWAFTRERRSAARSAARLASTTRQTSDAATASAAAGGSAAADSAGVAVLTPTAEVAGGEGAGERGESDRSDRAAMFGRIGVALTLLATVLLGAGVVTRGIAADRVPWSNLYEFAITGSFMVSVAYLVTLRRLRLDFLGLPITGFLLVILGIATTVLYTPVSGLIPALQSYWLVIHVSAAVIATSVFTLGAIASLLQILKAREERRLIATGASPAGSYLARLPSAEAIDRIAYRLNAFAFPVWTFALIAGAIWAAAAWGRYWGWDPKETWMFITWVCYAAYLHARSTAGWRSKVSGIALVAYGALLFNLVGVNFFISGLHSYA